MSTDTEWICSICLEGVNDDPCKLHACKHHSYHSICLVKANKADERCSLCRETGIPAAAIKPSVEIIGRSYTYHIRSVPNYTQAMRRVLFTSLVYQRLFNVNSFIDMYSKPNPGVFYLPNSVCHTWPF
jgi:hypothetical protein